MHKTAFEISENIAIYDGYTDGTHWNGWACPWWNACALWQQWTSEAP